MVSHAVVGGLAGQRADSVTACVAELLARVGGARDRFGVPGLRIFRLLLMHRQLEQKVIGEKAMLPIKDARELLYRMLKAGFVALQVRGGLSVWLPASLSAVRIKRARPGNAPPSVCLPPPGRVPSCPSKRLSVCLPAHVRALKDVPRTADHAPSRTFYTFRVNAEAACQTVSSWVYRALLNVRLRLQHELQSESEVTARLCRRRETDFRCLVATNG
jgi:hypothetical protein